MRQTLSTCVLILQFLAGTSQAYIPQPNRTVDLTLVNHVSLFDYNQFGHVQRVLSSDELAVQEMNLRIPVDLQNYNPQNDISYAANPNSGNHGTAARVLDQNINRILKDEQQRGSALGQASHIQSALQTNLALGGENGSIKHEIKFRINAASGTATMNYTGLMNAQLSYDLSHDGAMRAAIIHKLDKDTDLVLDHTTQSLNRTERLSVAWNF